MDNYFLGSGRLFKTSKWINTDGLNNQSNFIVKTNINLNFFVLTIFMNDE